MRLSNVLLRWYKSFHVNYREFYEKGQVNRYQPWNELRPEGIEDATFPFIEIGVEDDITTIVGANETGKSHLLNAINKVISGHGIDPQDTFSQTDLCHYAGIRKINCEAWPNIGLQFTFQSTDEVEDVCKAIGQDGQAPTLTKSPLKSFSLVLTPSNNSEATVYLEPNETGYPVSKEQLQKLRKLLPKVRFIDSKALLPSEIALAELISGYDASFKSTGLRDRSTVENVVAEIQSLTAPDPNALPAFKQALDAVKGKLNALAASRPSDNSLEMLLFKQILEVEEKTLKFIYGLSSADRGYVEGQIAKWNEGIDDLLNLSHFWHQDDQFRLIVDYKDGVVYFEIHDKTECIYTFDERSSGLKYFLSYYLQALAMEMSGRSTNSIVLMDEPDSALSILAQRNLLAVFESLVRPESSSQTCQLIYTTHSPYLINRNFPRRIKVVKKEDAEEGTQYIEQARARRYEPVRTALGIDSAPSLFLGSDNILLEGATDQFIITELVRVFSTPENVAEFIDLNSVVIVSADGVGNIANVLEQSRWADEPIPPTAVVLDSDAGAKQEVERVTRPDKPSKALLQDQQIRLIGDLIKPFGGNQVIVTMEDVIPVDMYKDAVTAYIERWLPETHKEKADAIKAALSDGDFGKQGIVASTKKLFEEIQAELGGDYDKMGVFRHVVDAVAQQAAGDPKDGSVLAVQGNVKAICKFLRDALSDARANTTRYSATRAIKRLIKDFRRLNKSRVPITNVQKLLGRLEREITPVGADGDEFLLAIKSYEKELEGARELGQQRLVGEAWDRWDKRIDQLQKNPLRTPTAAKTTVEEANGSVVKADPPGVAESEDSQPAAPTK